MHIRKSKTQIKIWVASVYSDGDQTGIPNTSETQIQLWVASIQSVGAFFFFEDDDGDD